MKNSVCFLFCLSVLICSVENVIAQKNDFTKNVKLYYNLEYTDFDRKYPERFQQVLRKAGANYSIGHLSPAISFSKNRMFREIEFSKILIGIKDDITENEFLGQNITEVYSGERKTTLDLALRIEGGLFLMRENDFFNPVLALSFQPYFTYGEINPKTSIQYNIYFRNGGTFIQFTPHFQIQANDRLMIDFAPAMSLMDFGVYYERTEDPGITFEEQIFQETFFDFFPKRFGIRLGIGYKI